MKIILLGGNAATNRQWLESLSAKLSSNLASIDTLHFANWDSPQPKDVDLVLETERLIKLIAHIDDRCVIVAKSAGLIVALQALKQSPNIQQIIGIGAPVMFGLDRGIDVVQMINSADLEYIDVIQQTADPQASARSLQATLTTAKVIAISGDDHKYAVDTKLVATIKSLLGEV